MIYRVIPQYTPSWEVMLTSSMDFHIKRKVVNFIEDYQRRCSALIEHLRRTS